MKEDEISIGANVQIEENARLIGIGEGPKSIVIGDNVYIGEDTKIIGNEITILDYTKVHNHCFLYAPKALSIGYNCWIGQNSILNAEAELTIQNNVCIGASSHLWTHIKFGDILQGCRFLSYKKMVIEDDVWFGGHCIVAPIRAKRRSVALAGSVIAKDMRENRVYAGSPAADVTHKLGPQFKAVPVGRKYRKMKDYLSEFLSSISVECQDSIEIVLNYPRTLKSDTTYFNVTDRTYTKRNTEIEHRFMTFLLPEKAKFIPTEKGHNKKEQELWKGRRKY